jgi:hypothetical protein
MDESFTLTLSSDESVDGEPDFSWIDRELDVVSRQQSSNFQIINGDASRSLVWTMTVIPKQSGALTIPPVRVGDLESNHIELVVRERAEVTATQTGPAKSEALFLQIEAEEGGLFVQQQMLYTIKLFLAHDAGMSVGNGSTLSEPEIEKGDAVIKRLGEDSNYQTVLNGKRYTVIERRYALYPQQSGSFSIKPILFDGRMVDSRSSGRSMFDTLQQRSQIKRIVSPTVEREIKAIPAEFNGRNWLPAKSVQLLEEWPEKQNSLLVGEPITRTLALLADGLTDAQLPAFVQNYPDGLKSYPDQPLLKETPSAQGITALRQEKIALVASVPGNLTLPAIEVAWWNTTTGKEEIARLPPRQITVTAAKGVPIVPPQAEAPIDHAVTDGKPTEDNKSSNGVIAGGVDLFGKSDGRWAVVALLLGMGWLMTLLLWWISSRSKASVAGAKTASAEKLSSLHRKIKKACSNNQAEAAKEALLQWAEVLWPESSPSSLGALSSRVDGEFADAIDELSRLLYGETKADWRGTALWNAFKNQPQTGQTSSDPSSNLEPLFRHQSV